MIAEMMDNLNEILLPRIVEALMTLSALYLAIASEEVMCLRIYSWHHSGGGIVVPHDLLGARTLINSTYDKVAWHILHHMHQDGFMDLPTHTSTVSPTTHFDQTVGTATEWFRSVFDQLTSHLHQTEVAEMARKVEHDEVQD